ncbi:MAG: DNA-protecting protein DprA [Ruminococcus sp.]|nr:DNA-protecting protein DprA [Ruminococcus sp.]
MRCSDKTLKLLAEKSGESVEYWERLFEANDLSDNFIAPMGAVSTGDADYPFFLDGNGNEIEVKRDRKNKPNKKGAPELLLYWGAISLLNEENFQKNVAVIGVLDPSESIIEREKKFVAKLVKSGMNIVSGLAEGCDAISHETCIENGGKTIAVLPCPLDHISPAKNRNLAMKIIESGGLLITEYFDQPKNRYDAVGRYVERDRLQAYFSKTIILTASYREDKSGISYPDDGKKRDCGSRHAMNISGNIMRTRYVMYNEKTDSEDEMFDLNRDLLKEENVKVITQNELQKISENQILPALSLFEQDE